MTTTLDRNIESRTDKGYTPATPLASVNLQSLSFMIDREFALGESRTKTVGWADRVATLCRSEGMPENSIQDIITRLT